jgi:hypothetical protein
MMLAFLDHRGGHLQSLDVNGQLPQFRSVGVGRTLLDHGCVEMLAARAALDAAQRKGERQWFT